MAPSGLYQSRWGNYIPLTLQHFSAMQKDIHSFGSDLSFTAGGCAAMKGKYVKVSVLPLIQTLNLTRPKM